MSSHLRFAGLRDHASCRLCSSPMVFISSGYCNKLPTAQWLETTEIYCLTIQKVISLKSRCQQTHAPSGGPRGTTIPCLFQLWWFSSVQFSSVTQLCPTLCDPMDCTIPGLPIHHQLLSVLKFMSIESVMPSNHLILCRPLLLLPSIFPSIRVFSNELVLHIRWPKYWSFSFSISLSNEYSGLISFRIDWLDLLAVQGTLKGFIQHPTVQKH